MTPLNQARRRTSEQRQPTIRPNRSIEPVPLVLVDIATATPRRNKYLSRCIEPHEACTKRSLARDGRPRSDTHAILQQQQKWLGCRLLLRLLGWSVFAAVCLDGRRCLMLNSADIIAA